MRARLHRHDWTGIGVVLAMAIAAILFREATIVPRAYVGVCAAAHAPLVCLPRQAVLWLQYERLFGLTALVLGLLGFAFAKRWLGVAALAIGVAAVVNYNGTEGIIGGALGLWGWLEAATPRQAPARNGRRNARQ